ncbi:hypothetical protein JSO54_07620 [Riemerella anatipestifer]|uniref:lipopolysaccharide biosynthesis protein n=1 Tax=Riemerella anatipestifer TaxID=34085 RepID=UPI001374BB9A|nr:lipopolysaccharide biosynthesis protein [Riemerella anatipestifer]
MKTLENKKILFICLKFFNYEKLIKQQMIDLGAEVDWFDERPSNTFFTKAMLRINKDFISNVINKYFKELIEKIKVKKYDYFFLIKGEATPRFFIDFLRKNNPNIKLIFFTWDSFKNNKNGLEIIKLFDKTYTFDPYDANQYEIDFRPLFYVQDYEKLNDEATNFQNELSFIGTAHSDRYGVTEKVRSWCEKKNFKTYAFYYSPSKLLFKLNKIFNRNFKQFDLKKISFNSLSHDEIIDIYRRTKVILDINHMGQKGLTMRTFECLGAGRKLMTTNKEVEKYPFFKTQNIFVLDREKVELNVNFFETGFIPLEVPLLEAMSLKGFIEELFGKVSHQYWEEVKINSRI